VPSPAFGKDSNSRQILDALPNNKLPYRSDRGDLADTVDKIGHRIIFANKLIDIFTSPCIQLFPTLFF
jgi:hypothetical protein